MLWPVYGIYENERFYYIYTASIHIRCVCAVRLCYLSSAAAAVVVAIVVVLLFVGLASHMLCASAIHRRVDGSIQMCVYACDLPAELQMLLVRSRMCFR